MPRYETLVSCHTGPLEHESSNGFLYVSRRASGCLKLSLFRLFFCGFACLRNQN
jgi:hypothetical protein